MEVVFERKQRQHLAVVVHAEHYSENATNENNITFGNYYDYQFLNAEIRLIFIVSTDRQKINHYKKFAKYTQHQPKIVLPFL